MELVGTVGGACLISVCRACDIMSRCTPGVPSGVPQGVDLWRAPEC